MRNPNRRLFGTILLAALGGGAALLQTAAPALAQPGPVERREGWMFLTLPDCRYWAPEAHQ